jgi:hypothetical protein
VSESKILPFSTFGFQLTAVAAFLLSKVSDEFAKYNAFFRSPGPLIFSLMLMMMQMLLIMLMAIRALP